MKRDSEVDDRTGHRLVLNRRDNTPYRTAQWLVAVFALLHNLEEALTMPRFAPLVDTRLSGAVPREILAVTEHLSWFYGALAFATIIPCLVVTAAGVWRNRVTSWAVVFVQSIFLVNVIVPHVPAAFLLGGYAPGIITAVAIELPFSIWFLRRSLREGVISAAGLTIAVGLAAPALLLALGSLYSVARA